MYDLNDLRLFAAVVAHRSFSAAARRFGIPKSRVSRSVSRLEEQLGLRLLERSTTRFRLTEAGQQIYEHARTAVAEAERVEDLALRLRSQPTGLVRVSCPHNLRSALTETLPAFLATHVHLRVQLIISNRRVDLIKEGVDIAIRVRESLDGDVDVQLKRLGPARGVLTASPDLLLDS